MTIQNISNSFKNFDLIKDSSFSFKERMDALKKMRSEALNQRTSSSTIVISGGGPAGLTRAIDALITGNQVTVLEKRAEDASGRDNTVALHNEYGETLSLLKYYGVYPYLLEKGLIFAERGGEFSVRLKDLEEAMKAVIRELTSDKVIHYHSQIERIHSSANTKATLSVNLAGTQKTLGGIDLLVVAEGARSPTNELLGNRRIAVLPSIPVVAAIFKDDRPWITGVGSTFQYIGKSLAYTAKSVYYYSIFFFKCIFQGENIFNSSRKIAGSLILKTPHQNYLGFGLSKQETEKMMDLFENLKTAKEKLRIAKEQNTDPSLLAELNKKLDGLQGEWDSYIHYWSAMSFCFANILNIFRAVLGLNKLQWGSWLPLHHATVTEIGADKSAVYSGKIGQSSYLLAGDTLATVDPTTGLGCNTAIRTAVDFHKYVDGLNSHGDIDFLQELYNRSCDTVITTIHGESKKLRAIYRPDAVRV